MEAAVTNPPKPSLRRILAILGTVLFLVGMLLFGIFLPFMECGWVVADPLGLGCYFVPLGVYYPIMAGAFLHLTLICYLAVWRKHEDPQWLTWGSFYHTAFVFLSSVIYVGYHLAHPGWIETAKGFSMQYQLLKPWHQQLGQELVFPFLLAATLILFFDSRVKWWLKPIMLLGLGAMIFIV